MISRRSCSSVEARLDAAQRLRDREVFLIEPLEATVDLVEVSEHLVAQLGDPGVHRVDPPTELAKLMGDLAEPPVDLAESPVDPVEALVRIRPKRWSIWSKRWSIWAKRWSIWSKRWSISENRRVRRSTSCSCSLDVMGHLYLRPIGRSSVSRRGHRAMCLGRAPLG